MMMVSPPPSSSSSSRHDVDDVVIQNKNKNNAEDDDDATPRQQRQRQQNIGNHEQQEERFRIEHRQPQHLSSLSSSSIGSSSSSSASTCSCRSNDNNNKRTETSSSKSTNTITTSTTSSTIRTSSSSNTAGAAAAISTTAASSMSIMTTTIQRLQLILHSLLPWTMILVWPCMLFVPIILSTPGSIFHYTKVFSSTWYDILDEHGGNYDNDIVDTPKPLGLILGITAVGVGQVFVWIFFYLYKYGYLITKRSHKKQYKQNEPISIQTQGAPLYNFWDGLTGHISQPEGFTLLVGYLSITWMMNWMPARYYSFQGTVQYKETIMCLILQDILQYAMHYMEHMISPTFYKSSHKPHHVFKNPKLFDAFHGSSADTICMILVPLFITAQCIRTCNVWTYMAFGSIYANWLTLIHSEYTMPWDNFFRVFKLGTSADHHVHHKYFIYNYGHLFMWSDILFNTYRNPNHFYVHDDNQNDDHHIAKEDSNERKIIAHSTSSLLKKNGFNPGV